MNYCFLEGSNKGEKVKMGGREDKWERGFIM